MTFVQVSPLGHAWVILKHALCNSMYSAFRNGQGGKDPGAGDFPQLLYMSMTPGYFTGDKRKIEPKKLPSYLAIHLLITNCIIMHSNLKS